MDERADSKVWRNDCSLFWLVEVGVAVMVVFEV